MQHQRRKKSELSSGSRLLHCDHFAPLLADIQIKLGESWVFYEECMAGILNAAAEQRDVIAWLEQMQQLVHGNDTVTFSHEGVLFLLGDMGIQLPKQRNWGEGERYFVGKHPSPPLLPPTSPTEPQSPRINNLATLSPLPYHAMTTLLPLRPLRPDTPFFESAPLSSSSHAQQRQAPNNLDRTQKDLRAFHCPPEQITMTANHAPPSPNPLRRQSSNPIFFTDPALREDIAELFGHTVRGTDSSNGDVLQTRSSVVGFHIVVRQTLPYHANEDDVLVWKKRLDGGEENQASDSEVKTADWGVGAWPPWNFRFDLEM
ncbi:hypothetical protein M3J09_009825 [Ascochyta lentis]